MTEQQAPERFTKKPVTITAIQWTGDNLKAVLDFTGKHHKWADWFADFAAYEAHVKADGNVFKIFTLEGVMDALPGDWIIRGVQGEHYPCKPGIFSATYSPADLTPPSDQSATIARLTAERDDWKARYFRMRDERDKAQIASANYASFNHEWRQRAEAAEAKLAKIMAERDEWKDEYKTAEKGLNVYRKANVKVIAERDAARAALVQTDP